MYICTGKTEEDKLIHSLQKKKGQVNTYSSHKLIYMINKMEEPRRDNHYYDKTLNNVKFHSLPTT